MFTAPTAAAAAYTWHPDGQLANFSDDRLFNFHWNCGANSFSKWLMIDGRSFILLYGAVDLSDD